MRTSKLTLYLPSFLQLRVNADNTATRAGKHVLYKSHFEHFESIQLWFAQLLSLSYIYLTWKTAFYYFT